MATNRSLSADSLFALMHSGFEQVPDQPAENAKISLPDALMSGFALFSLKDPSLLAFDERRTTDSNLQRAYGKGGGQSDKMPQMSKLVGIKPDFSPGGYSFDVWSKR